MKEKNERNRKSKINYKHQEVLFQVRFFLPCRDHKIVIKMRKEALEKTTYLQMVFLRFLTLCYHKRTRMLKNE